eukprot:300840-Hanusia_phi.AAC.3
MANILRNRRRWQGDLQHSGASPLQVARSRGILLAFPVPSTRREHSWAELNDGFILRGLCKEDLLGRKRLELTALTESIAERLCAFCALPCCQVKISPETLDTFTSSFFILAIRDNAFTVLPLLTIA